MLHCMRETERERTPKECFHDNICKGWQIPNKQSSCQQLSGHWLYSRTVSVTGDCLHKSRCLMLLLHATQARHVTGLPQMDREFKEIQ